MYCRARELSEKLTDGELFLLIASQHRGKSETQRVLAEVSLETPSIQKPLLSRGATVEAVVKRLVEKGFFLRIRRGLVRSTENGATVKHAYNRVRNQLILDEKLRSSVAQSIEFVPRLRQAVAEECRSREPPPPPPPPPPPAPASSAGT